jgi:hypothetical protein
VSGAYLYNVNYLEKNNIYEKYGNRERALTDEEHFVVNLVID